MGAPAPMGLSTDQGVGEPGAPTHASGATFWLRPRWLMRTDRSQRTRLVVATTPSQAGLITNTEGEAWPNAAEKPQGLSSTQESAPSAWTLGWEWLRRSKIRSPAQRPLDGTAPPTSPTTSTASVEEVTVSMDTEPSRPGHAASASAEPSASAPATDTSGCASATAHTQASATASARSGGLQYRRFEFSGATFEVDSRYRLTSLVGKGTFGLVCAAEDSTAADPPNEESSAEGSPPRMVAVKKIIDPFRMSLDSKRLLREVRLLRALQHPCVLHLLDLCPPPSLSTSDWKDVYLVTELFETNLHRVIYCNTGNPLTDGHVQLIMWQIFRALRYMHAAGVVHRDLKPTNLLINRDSKLALADLGLARHISKDIALSSDVGPDQAGGRLTKYVVTRWYRAPELLVQNQSYDSGVDMWSVGCIMAELLGSKALFRGTNALHQLQLIVEKLGKPPEDELALLDHPQAAAYIRGLREDAAVAGVSSRARLKGLYPAASAECLDLLEQLLQFSPNKRLTAAQALHHPYLKAYHAASAEELPTPRVDMAFEAQQPSRETLRRLLWDEVAHFHPEVLDSE